MTNTKDSATYKALINSYCVQFLHIHTIRILLSSMQRILSEPQHCTGLFKMIVVVLTTCHT